MELKLQGGNIVFTLNKDGTLTIWLDGAATTLTREDAATLQEWAADNVETP